MDPLIKTSSKIATVLMTLILGGGSFAKEPDALRPQPINPPPLTQEEKDAQKVAEGQKTKGEKAQPEIDAPPEKSESKESVPERSGVTPVMPEKKSPESGEDLQKRPIEESKNPSIKEGPPARGGKNEGVAPKEEKPIEPKPDMKPPTVREPVTPLGKESGKETPPKVVAPPAGGKEPQDIETKIKQKYQALKDPKISYDDFRKFEIEEADRLDQLNFDPSRRYNTNLRLDLNRRFTHTACGNGDFESGLDPAQWRGAYGSSAGNNFSGYHASGVTQTYFMWTSNLTNFTTGIIPAPGTPSSQNILQMPRQKLVDQGVDAWVGIQRTGPVGPAYSLLSPRSQHAVCLGNTQAGSGAELLSKTFTVTQNESTIGFWYAVVCELNNWTEGGLPIRSPFFQVRVLDVTGTPIPGLVDLGLGSENNGYGVIIPTLSGYGNTVQTKIGTPLNPNTQIRYRDWSCASINLTQHVGEVITLEFLTADSTDGNSWCYAYIDNLCGKCGMGNPSGNIEFNAATSSKCGLGFISFDLSVPAGGGTAVINLNIYQNGTKLKTITSPGIQSGNSHSFSINPSTIPGLNPALGGFDFTATGTFTLRSRVTRLTIGNLPYGQIFGSNNDYKIQCDPEINNVEK